MEKQGRRWEWAGLAVTLAAGNLLHFLYEWTGRAPAAAFFSAVNESVWEHMKLLAVPLILFTLAQLLLGGRSREGLLWRRGVGLLAGLAAIPLLYYTYTGILGRDVMWVDIVIFQLAVLLTFWVGAVAGRRPRRDPVWQVLGGLLLVGIALCFVLFTRQAPELPLFLPPAALRSGSIH